jgi:selenocysteine-specific elongation factor
MAHTVIGTAGHIDHGKTLLVKCLTGEETDRTPQEKARGITIELGFAFLGDEATIIDVPGHERFVKTMVAGVSSIDLALFVIAADDGVMPQSREHLDILELLGVTRGIIVLNKVDLAEEEWLEMVEGDIGDLVEGTFLERADIHRVSALSGQGIDDLQRAIQEMITETRVRQAGGLFRMPVDRSFLIKGFGLVCTGTVLSGSLGEGDSAEMLPVGRRLRARGLQQHGQAVAEVGAGDRAAINVPGVEQADAGRGQVIVADGVFEPTHMVDVRLKLLPSCPKPVQQRSRVRFHLGTAEVLARVVLLDRDTLEPGDEALAQLRLESPVVAVWGDRFVLRRYSPALTIGGGRILDPHPPKHRPSSKGVAAQLQKLESEEIDQVVEARLSAGVAGFESVRSMAGSLGLDQEQMELIVGRLAAGGRLVRCTIDNAECLVHGGAWQELVADIEKLLQTFHSANPLKEGLNREDLRHQCGRQRSELFDAVLSQMSNEGAVNLVGALVRSARHQISFSQDEERLRSRIEEELKSADFGGMPDSRELSKRLQIEEKAVAQLLRAMQSLGSVIYLDETLFLHSDTVAAARTKLRGYLEVNTGITVSQFRELINSNRKYALALLNRFDSDGFTQRQEDVRILR